MNGRVLYKTVYPPSPGGAAPRISDAFAEPSQTTVCATLDRGHPLGCREDAQRPFLTHTAASSFIFPCWPRQRRVIVQDSILPLTTYRNESTMVNGIIEKRLTWVT